MAPAAEALLSAQREALSRERDAMRAAMEARRSEAKAMDDAAEEDAYADASMDDFGDLDDDDDFGGSARREAKGEAREWEAGVPPLPEWRRAEGNDDDGPLVSSRDTTVEVAVMETVLGYTPRGAGSPVSADGSDGSEGYVVVEEDDD